jgi:hypothetical protein
MTMRDTLRWIPLVAMCVAVLTASPMWAQETPSNLVGVVVDPEGTAIAGARIRVVRPTADGADETPLANDVTTDRTGRFEVTGLVPGPVRFTVAHPQHERLLTDAELAAGVTVSLRITLRRRDSLPDVEAAPRTMRGVVRDSSGAPVPDVEVSVVGTESSFRTDSLGRFVLPVSSAAPIWLRARRLGYAAAFVRPADDDSTSTQIIVRPLGQELERVTVVATRMSRTMADMDQRKTLYGGVHVRREEIERLNPVQTSQLLLGRNAAIRVQRGRGSEGTPMGRNDCPMAILLNGVHFPKVSVDLLVSPREIAAIEAYPSRASTPSEFIARLPTGAEECGVLAVWTR